MPPPPIAPPGLRVANAAVAKAITIAMARIREIVFFIIFSS
jgi:hypothetical protein